MRETAPTTAPTADTTTDELVLATELYDRARDVDPPLVIAEITASLAAARRAGFAAGLEERADEAHAAGYAEGLAAGGLAGVRETLVEARGTHDCPVCNTGQRTVGVLPGGRTCPLCDGFGTL